MAWIASDRGGYFATAWSWTALAGLLVCTFTLVLSRSIELGRLDVLLIAGLAAFTAWTLVSVIWSDSVPSTLDSTTRCLAYLALAAAALLLTGPRTSRHLLGGVLTGAALVCLYALATRLLPDRIGTFDSVAADYRLSTPVTYWNGLGVFAVMTLLLACTFAVRGTRPAVRAASAAALPPVAATMYFTFSRGAWLALASGLFVFIAVDRRRLQLTAGVALLAVPTASAVWLASRPAALRVRDSTLSAAAAAGHHLLWQMVLLAAASAAAAAAFHVGERRLSVPRALRAAWVASGVVALFAGFGLLWIERGSPVHEARAAWSAFNQPPGHGGANLGARLFDLSSNGRAQLWRLAWHSFERKPLLGHGAGTFWQAWAAKPGATFKAQDAHDLYLQTLSELGPLGLALLLAFLFAPIVAALRVRGRLTSGALAVYCAWLVHAAVDWDWQLLGVSAVAVLSGAAIVARARSSEAARREFVRWPLVAISIALAAVGFCTAMANVSLARAADSYAHGSLGAADRYARRAARWNRWSAAAWDLRASVAAQRGDAGAARADMLEATRRDPHNWQLELRLALVTDGDERTRAFSTARRLSPPHAPKKLPPPLVRKRAPAR